MSDPFAVLSNVTCRRGGALAVDDLSIDVRRGESVALLGPNGAGKTTTLELLLGLVQPQAGVVHVTGSAPRDAIARGRVGAMLQSGGLPPRATVVELVELVRGLYPHPLPLDDALALCDLRHVAGRRVETLSGGEQERVRLALSVAGGPELLVLDEPTAAMDVSARRAFWARASEYVAEGRSLVFASHRLEEADGVANRVVVLSHGRVVADAAPDELKASMAVGGSVRFSAGGVPLQALERLPAVDAVELDDGRVTLHSFDPDRTLRALLERVPEIDGLEVTRPRLEDAFLGLIDHGGA